MKYIGNNYCPNCDADLSKEYEKYDDTGLKDGFICPHCEAIIGYKSIYAWIGLILLGLGGLSAIAGLGCAVSHWLSLINIYINSACIALEWNTTWVGILLLGFSMFMLMFNASYVLKMPNKSVKQTD